MTVRNPILLAGIHLLLVAGAIGCRRPTATPTPFGPPTPTRPPASTPDAWLGRGQPARIRIPDIGVDAVVEALALTPEQKIAVPKAWENVGWYREGFRPGEPGRAVLSGHVDDDKGRPAVFARLGEIRPGALIQVDYEDASRVTFAAASQKVVRADAVDAATWDLIFGPAEEPLLSLITCDGAWDAVAKTYRDRLIILAGQPKEQAPRE